MTEANSRNSHPNLTLTLNRILETGHLNRQDYFYIKTIFLSEFKINQQEKNLINRIFDDLQVGRLKFLN